MKKLLLTVLLCLWATCAFATELDRDMTKLLCHFDGTNGQTTYTSDDANARTATFFNSAQLSTAQKVFGTASLLLASATRDYITLSGGLTLETSDFTHGGRLYTGDLSSAGEEFYFLLGSDNIYDNGEGFTIYHYTASHGLNGVRFQLLFNTNNGISAPTSILSDNTWYSWEWDRKDGVFYFFLNGTLLYIDSSHTSSSILEINPIQVGRANWGFEWGTFYLDELYTIKGQALHTSDYTPETEAYTLSGGAAPVYSHAFNSGFNEGFSDGFN